MQSNKNIKFEIKLGEQHEKIFFEKSNENTKFKKKYWGKSKKIDYFEK